VSKLSLQQQEGKQQQAFSIPNGLISNCIGTWWGLERRMVKLNPLADKTLHERARCGRAATLFGWVWWVYFRPVFRKPARFRRLAQTGLAVPLGKLARSSDPHSILSEQFAQQRIDERFIKYVY
jgi:hypothetical protein